MFEAIEEIIDDSKKSRLVFLVLAPISKDYCGRRSKGTDSGGAGSFLQLMKAQEPVEHLAPGRAVPIG